MFTTSQKRSLATLNLTFRSSSRFFAASLGANQKYDLLKKKKYFRWKELKRAHSFAGSELYFCIFSSSCQASHREVGWLAGRPSNLNYTISYQIHPEESEAKDWKSSLGLLDWKSSLGLLHCQINHKETIMQV